MQTIDILVNRKLMSLEIPSPEDEVMLNVKWGSPSQLFTPAYWVVQLFCREPKIRNHRLGSSLLEEIAVCLLGGHGIKAEIGLAAFNKLKEANMYQKACTFNDIYNCLNKPIDINGKALKYRFAKQKSYYLEDAIKKYYSNNIEYSTAHTLRSWLMTIKGIGPKTASWITRNWLNSDEVAILDIHILRAGTLAGFFNHQDKVETNYFNLERKYLHFARAIKVNPANLDAIMWEDMRSAPKTVSQMFAAQHCPA